MARHVRHHQVEWVTTGVRRAAARAGVELPVSYARRVATEGLAHEAHLGVTRLGAGVVIHTAPEARNRLPVVVGYADARGQWHLDGSRHVEVPAADGPTEPVEVGL
jgi:hypothetical protein